MTYGLLCLALSTLIFGGFFVMMGISYPGSSSMYTFFLQFGLLISFPGLILFIYQLRFGMHWNRVVRFVISQEQIAIDEISRRVRLPIIRVSDILYDAISSGSLPGIVREDVFVSRFKLAQDGVEMLDYI